MLTDEQLARVHDKVTPQGDHWMWTGSKTSVGYANATIGGRSVYVQKALWESDNGTVKPGYRLFNNCGHRLCVNPAHWEVRPFG